MALSDYKVSSQDSRYKRVQNTSGDTLTGTVEENKRVFDDYPDYIAEQHNNLIDNINPSSVGAVPNSASNISNVRPYGSDGVKISIEGTNAVDHTEYLFGARATAPYLYNDTTDTTVWTGYTTLNKPTPADIGAVPATRKVNGKALSSDISFTASELNGVTRDKTYIYETGFFGSDASRLAIYGKNPEFENHEFVISAYGDRPVLRDSTANTTIWTGYTDKYKPSPADIGAVAVVSGKGLSTNDYTTTEKNKLAGIATGANNYTHPSYTARTGVPTTNVSPDFGGTFSVSQPVSDSKGHITAINSRTITIPGTVASTSAKGLMSSAMVTKLNGISSSGYSGESNFSTTLTSTRDTTVKSITLPSNKLCIVLAQVTFELGESVGSDDDIVTLELKKSGIINHTVVSGRGAYYSDYGYVAMLQTIGFVSGGTVDVVVSSGKSNINCEGSVCYIALGV